MIFAVNCIVTENVWLKVTDASNCAEVQSR